MAKLYGLGNTVLFLDHVDYAAPEDINEWVQSIKRLVSDEEYRKHQEENILQAELRSWKDVAVHLGQLLGD